MVIRDVSTPVVILKCEHYGALGIVRSLGRLGVPVYCVDGDCSAPAVVSKYCRGVFMWDIEHEPERKTVKFLSIVAQEFKSKPLLIPTSDETTQLVAQYAAELKQSFVFPCQPYTLVRTLCSKRDMFFLAKKQGIPTAETQFPKSVRDVHQMVRDGAAQFPLMLKGIDGGKLWRRTGKKMLIVHSMEELTRNFELMEDFQEPNLMLQEYIPGGDDSVWMFNGYFNEQSECVAEFTGKKIHQNPVYVGMTALGVCLWNTMVAEITKRFMESIHYRGILDIGFRYDSRDGRYKVLDVNPRVGATFRLFVGANGLDVVRALYLDQTHQPVPPTTQREGRKWVVEDKDILSTYHYLRDGKLTAKEWFRSLRGIEEAGYFCTDDIRPFLAMVARHIRKLLGSTGRWMRLSTVRTRKDGHRLKKEIYRGHIGQVDSEPPGDTKLFTASRRAEYRQTEYGRENR
ncbi:MAG: hypothetical protein HY562_01600 [Ignavibacteriales bacterium]|nr:hypothetical protein [Ignavibacteriales bacterium]